MTIPQSRLRNFSIIAHIDHGKSTLADRLLETTHTIDGAPDDEPGPRLDGPRAREGDHDQGARRPPRVHGGATACVYGLNLIDTPGHVDFAYEVSRSLQACEGAILVVDAAQGIEAQTLANVHLALREGLTIIPVINKIDLPVGRARARHGGAGERPRDPARGGDPRVSAKEGIGVAEILEAIVDRVPPPKGDPAAAAPGARVRLALRRRTRAWSATSGSPRARSATTTSSG